ncbi:MAG: hypothetical protein C0502_09355 [Opitutus sp.]|nr:hypothetical protein [Opitutus sp.]
MSLRFFVALLALALIPAGAGAKEVKVEASRAIKLAVIDADRKAPGREAFHQTFADTLGYELGQRLKEPTPVKPVTQDADRAAFGLGNGIFDVALVVGHNLPRALVSSDFDVLKAAPTSGKGKFHLYFIIRKDDASLAKLMQDAFPEALKGQFFLRAYAKQLGEDPDHFGVVLAAK